MAKHRAVNIQFHARLDELGQFADACRHRYGLHCTVICRSPEYLAEEISIDAKLLPALTAQLDASKNCELMFTLDRPANEVAYNEIEKSNPNALFLKLGAETHGTIGESWLVTAPQMESEVASRCWRKVANDLKKMTKAGAWGENKRTGGRAFYRNHRYTKGAVSAQQDGLELVFSGTTVRSDVLAPPPDKT